MFDIVSIGSATRDVFLGGLDFAKLTGPEFLSGEGIGFNLGSKYEVKNLVLTTGGGGANTAVTFARQGLKTACIGVVGNDLNGTAILNELLNEGVDISFFQKHNQAGEYSVIIVHENGERTILSYKGEGQNFESDKTDFSSIKTKWFYLDSLGGHYDFLEKVLNWASDNNIKIAADPGGKELALGLEKLKPLFKQATIVHLNREEAAKLTGVEFTDEAGIFKKADELISGIFIMSNGHEGVAVSDGKNIYRAGVPDSPVVERTGAGDAFTSGFISEYIRSEDIAKATQFATANASSVVTQYGAKAGILKKDDWGPWPLVEVSIDPRA